MIKNLFVVLVFLAIIIFPVFIVKMFPSQTEPDETGETKTSSSFFPFFRNSSKETSEEKFQVISDTSSSFLPTVKTDTKKTETKTATPPAPKETEKTAEILDPNASIYKGKIKITSLSGKSDKPEAEYVIIKNISNEPINITGFKIRNSYKEDVVIPKAFKLPGTSALMTDDIILEPTKGEARITMGWQEKQMNFLENICTGYFAEQSNFGISLQKKCPKPSFSYLDFSDACLKKMDSIRNCHFPTHAELQGLYDNACIQYINEHFNYAGCLKEFKTRTDFYSNRWLVWMNRKVNFFRNYHEKILLLDRENKIIFEYSY